MIDRFEWSTWVAGDNHAAKVHGLDGHYSKVLILGCVQQNVSLLEQQNALVIRDWSQKDHAICHSKLGNESLELLVVVHILWKSLIVATRNHKHTFLLCSMH